MNEEAIGVPLLTLTCAALTHWAIHWSCWPPGSRRSAERRVWSCGWDLKTHQRAISIKMTKEPPQSQRSTGETTSQG